jgi:hypothetical protein
MSKTNFNVILIVILFLGTANLLCSKEPNGSREQYFKQGWLWGHISGMEEVIHTIDNKWAVYHPDNEDDAWNEWKETFKDKKPLSWEMENGR